MNTVSWTTSLDDRVTRVDNPAEPSNQLASELGRMGNSGGLETTPAFLTRTGKPSIW